MDFSSVSNEKKEEMVFVAICKLGDTQQMGVAGVTSIKKKIKCGACSPIPGHITPETWRRKDSAQLTASEVPCSLCLTDLGLW